MWGEGDVKSYVQISFWDSSPYTIIDDSPHITNVVTTWYKTASMPVISTSETAPTAEHRLLSDIIIDQLSYEYDCADLRELCRMTKKDCGEFQVQPSFYHLFIIKNYCCVDLQSSILNLQCSGFYLRCSYSVFMWFSSCDKKLLLRYHGIAQSLLEESNVECKAKIIQPPFYTFKNVWNINHT